MIFDIVIPVAPNDIGILKKQIVYTLKNIIGYRNVYIICRNNSLNIEGCNTINEDIFPFSLETVSKYHGNTSRNGWYLQQLFKLYSGLIIPNILDKYLVIDSDTFFLKPTFFYENGRCLYNYGNENHPDYFQHMKLLHPRLKKVYTDKSGICHHMIFETKYIEELFDMVESKHNDFFYNIFLKNVEKNNYDMFGSGASEYEIYFNFIMNDYRDEVKLRELKWSNSDVCKRDIDYDYISYHNYMNKPPNIF